MKNCSDEYLMISGIQHFIFCPRQWAFTHVESIWEDNLKTYLGDTFHKKVDNPYIIETRNDILISRSVPLVSHSLCIRGISDCIEFHKRKDDNGVKIIDRQGTYDVIPIEYKVGNKKQDTSDILQLCAQAICLEEMMETRVEYGYIYYGKTRKRLKVDITLELRDLLSKTLKDMYYYFENGITPKPKYKNQCKSCSLYNKCLPVLGKKNINVRKYIKSYIGDD